MKIKEVDVEEALIKSGQHPDYIQSLKDIEEKRNERQEEAVNRLGSAVKSCEADFDTRFKFAQDTFKV